MKSYALILTALCLRTALAHSFFAQLNNNPAGKAIREPPSNDPVTDVTSNSIACNVAQPTTKDMISLAAGSQAQLTWRHELMGGSGSDVIDASHHGPVTAWMKKVSDATTDPGYGNGWFKIAEDGYEGGAWGVDRLIQAQGQQMVTIPACLPAGQYLLRGEIIALHNAQQVGGAQFFTECAQVNVQGGNGTSRRKTRRGNMPATVALPGAYQATDPGIKVDIYNQLSSYTPPGPAPFTC